MTLYTYNCMNITTLHASLYIVHYNLVVKKATTPTLSIDLNVVNDGSYSREVTGSGNERYTAHKGSLSSGDILAPIHVLRIL